VRIGGSEGAAGAKLRRADEVRLKEGVNGGLRCLLASCKRIVINNAALPVASRKARKPLRSPRSRLRGACGLAEGEAH
jgi:hypothetical protein